MYVNLSKQRHLPFPAPRGWCIFTRVPWDTQPRTGYYSLSYSMRIMNLQALVTAEAKPLWLIPEKNIRQQWRSRTQKYDQETEPAQSPNHSYSFNQSQFRESLSQVLNSGCSLNSEPIANSTNAKLFTSIHCNSITASSTKMAKYFDHLVYSKHYLDGLH